MFKTFSCSFWGGSLPNLLFFYNWCPITKQFLSYQFSEKQYMLYSHDTTIRIHIHAETYSTIMTNEHISLEKYTSHTLFLKGLRKSWRWLCVRGELETEQTATYWPQVPLTIAALLPHSAVLLDRSPEGPSPLAGAGSHSAGKCDLNWTATRTPTNLSRLWHLVI